MKQQEQWGENRSEVAVESQGRKWLPKAGGGGGHCVQMDFMRTFQINTKCNNINHV